jgi:PIN domain nuclease of toxin-antitoxin system
VRLLLDTHALIWWLAGDALLSRAVRRALTDEGNDVFVSAASAWEIATKHRLGKLAAAATLASDVAAAVAGQGFIELPITLRHAQAAGGLPGTHKDPFDRMLIAQASLENMMLVSRETVFDAYGVHRLW